MPEIKAFYEWVITLFPQTWRESIGIGFGSIVILMLLLASAKKLGLIERFFWDQPDKEPVTPRPTPEQTPEPRRISNAAEAADILEKALTRGEVDADKVLAAVGAAGLDKEPERPPRKAVAEKQGQDASVVRGAVMLAAGPQAKDIAERLYQRAVSQDEGNTDELAKAAFVQTVQDILVAPNREELRALQYLAEGKKKEAFDVLRADATKPSERRLRTLAALQAPVDKESAADAFSKLVTVSDPRAFRRNEIVAAYALPSAPQAEIGIISGDLAGVRSIDAWVNSENDWLLMARMMDRTISGSIRYLSARVDKDGLPLNDPMQRALRPNGYGRVHRQPLGSVRMTKAGELKKTHNVRRIVHVVSVMARARAHVTAGGNFDDYVVRAIELVDRHNKSPFRVFAGGALRSMIMPPFGTGHGQVDPAMAADMLVEGLIQGMRGRSPSASLQRVYLLAYSPRELQPLRESFEKRIVTGDLQPAQPRP